MLHSRSLSANYRENSTDYCSTLKIWPAAFRHSSMGVTRKHWPPVHGPPLWTGSVDYLETGPQTTPTYPSTDHPPNKIKNKNKDFTYCLCNRSLMSGKFRALHWSMLGKCDRPGFSLRCKLCHCRSSLLCHFHCCGFAWKTRKPQKFLISFPLPFSLAPSRRFEGLSQPSTFFSRLTAWINSKNRWIHVWITFIRFVFLGDSWF